jgi:hypothetical protein
MNLEESSCLAESKLLFQHLPAWTEKATESLIQDSWNVALCSHVEVD